MSTSEYTEKRCQRLLITQHHLQSIPLLLCLFITDSAFHRNWTPTNFHLSVSATFSRILCTSCSCFLPLKRMSRARYVCKDSRWPFCLLCSAGQWKPMKSRIYHARRSDGPQLHIPRYGTVRWDAIPAQRLIPWQIVAITNASTTSNLPIGPRQSVWAFEASIVIRFYCRSSSTIHVYVVQVHKLDDVTHMSKDYCMVFQQLHL